LAIVELLYAERRASMSLDGWSLLEEEPSRLQTSPGGYDEKRQGTTRELSRRIHSWLSDRSRDSGRDSRHSRSVRHARKYDAAFNRRESGTSSRWRGYFIVDSLVMMRRRRRAGNGLRSTRSFGDRYAQRACWLRRKPRCATATTNERATRRRWRSSTYRRSSSSGCTHL
jgi:hypothetical protein